MRTEQITVRLPVERVQALKAAAKAQNRSLANLLTVILNGVEAAQVKVDDLTDRCAELESEVEEMRRVTLLPVAPPFSASSCSENVTPRFKAPRR